MDALHRKQSRQDVHDSWNATNLVFRNTNVDTDNAGQITAITSPMRNMQFGVRLVWWKGR